MPRTVAIGLQDFGDIISKNCFYIDKTAFIREWWENEDGVTLITRPRRFGKTLTMNMVDYFFSTDHAGDRELFEGLLIFEEEKYRRLQGTYPVISLSFANVKDADFKGALYKISNILFEQFQKHQYLLDGELLSEAEKAHYRSFIPGIEAPQMEMSLYFLSSYLRRYYGKKVLILLDEYDTPMQEAYVNGYWDEAAQFFRNLMNSTFKTNPHVEKALITGITRVSKESMFSDLNNLRVVTTTSREYATAFGFTEEEVFAAMDEYGVTTREEMKRWYDGFQFGSVTDIYNPWSVINALRNREYAPYWVNTSSNALLNKIMKQGSAELKMQMEELLKGNSITCFGDEEVVYNQLDTNPDAVWSLMVATGYLKVEKVEEVGRFHRRCYTLRTLNMEVEIMLSEMVKGWFSNDNMNYNGFIQALLQNDVQTMNSFMNDIALVSFSSFDTAKNITGRDAPERFPTREATTSSFKEQNSCACFYHGFVLGLMVELDGRYEIKSNRESGFGRYDVMMRPLNPDKDNAYIIEFKVKKKSEESLEDTLKNAHAQIEEKQYAQELTASGIPEDHIKKYGFAFEGKNVLIG
jgi:hypothetical protein